MCERNRMIMKKSMIITLGILSAILVIAFIIWSAISGRVAMNPPGTVGNTAGNLYNEGMFCEYDNMVYFVNSYPNGGIFSMSPDESNITRLNSMQARNILAGGQYLYYFHTGTLASDTSFSQLPGTKSFNRCKLNGGEDTTLSRDLISMGQLVDNYLYLLTASGNQNTFLKQKIDNSEKVKLADYVIMPACAVNGMIYYSGSKDHYLHELNTTTDADRVMWEGAVWNPVVEGDYVYYMNISDNYRLYRYSLSQNTEQKLTDDRVDCFNVGSGYIYYQKNHADTPQLKVMSMDGSSSWILAEGNYTHINMTSQYVYFQAFGDPYTLYHSRVGSNNYQTFTAASEAIGQ